jgi:hypothetical protein
MMLEVWRAWVAAFDQCCEDGQWSRLERFLTPDATYMVSGVPFACAISGREAIIKGFEKSIRNFDNRFDERRWFGVGIKCFDPGAITGRSMGWYRLGELPPLTFSASSQWLFRGGQITMMSDVYDANEIDAQDAMIWLATHAPDFDPSYV